MMRLLGPEELRLGSALCLHHQQIHIFSKTLTLPCFSNSSFVQLLPVLTNALSDQSLDKVTMSSMDFVEDGKFRLEKCCIKKGCVGNAVQAKL